MREVIFYFPSSSHFSFPTFIISLSLPSHELLTKIFIKRKEKSFIKRFFFYPEKVYLAGKWPTLLPLSTEKIKCTHFIFFTLSAFRKMNQVTWKAKSNPIQSTHMVIWWKLHVSTKNTIGFFLLMEKVQWNLYSNQADLLKNCLLQLDGWNGLHMFICGSIIIFICSCTHKNALYYSFFLFISSLSLSCSRL